VTDSRIGEFCERTSQIQMHLNALRRIQLEWADGTIPLPDYNRYSVSYYETQNLSYVLIGGRETIKELRPAILKRAEKERAGIAVDLDGPH